MKPTAFLLEHVINAHGGLERWQSAGELTLKHFGADSLLRRQNYTAEEFGKRANAAHYCFDHREFGGLVFPGRRRAFISDVRPLGDLHHSSPARRGLPL